MTLEPPPGQKQVRATGRDPAMEMGGSRPVSRVIGTRHFHTSWKESNGDVDLRAGARGQPVMRHNQIAGGGPGLEHRRRAIPAHCISASDVRQRSVPTSQNEFR